jgi:hypothetical protein
MGILNVTDDKFKVYGKIWSDIDVEDLLTEMAHTNTPKDSVVYVPLDDELQSTKSMPEFRDRVFGGLPIQVGYCNGYNKALNAVEYHRNSEINVAQTDLVLLIGKLQDVTAEFAYDTANIETFFVPAGTVLEMYETTLHYAPCTAKGQEFFRCVVVLPEGTNTDITFELKGTDEDKLMTAKNKWLIAHKEAKIAGAFEGLVGENITVE